MAVPLYAEDSVFIEKVVLTAKAPLFYSLGRLREKVGKSFIRSSVSCLDRLKWGVLFREANLRRKLARTPDCNNYRFLLESRCQSDVKCQRQTVTC